MSRVVMTESVNGRGEASAPPAPLPAPAVRVMVVNVRLAGSPDENELLYHININIPSK